MSSGALVPPKIEGRIWPRTRVDEGGRYLGIPSNGAFQHSRVSRKPGAVQVRVDDGPAGEIKTLASVNIPTGMGGIFLYVGTGEGLQRNPDCF